MKLLGWVTLVAVVLLALFAVANWNLLTAPAMLNFLVFSVEGPLGIILLAVAMTFAGLSAIYALTLRASALIETSRHIKALDVMRRLAEEADASRFTALSAQIEQEFSSLRASMDNGRSDTMRHVEGVEAALVRSLQETANSLYAHLGEIDGKLDVLTGSTAHTRKI